MKKINKKMLELVAWRILTGIHNKNDIIKHLAHKYNLSEVYVKNLMKSKKEN